MLTWRPCKQVKPCLSLLLLTLLFAACTPTNTPAPAPAPSPTPAPPRTPTPTLPPVTLSAPNYSQSDFTVELGRPFALRQDQSARIPGEDLTIIHTTDIEFTCPEDAACEVPLIATDYFTLMQAGETIDMQPWQWEMTLGDYVLTTLQMYSGYEYQEHQFEIILTVEKQDAVIAAQQTQTANPALTAVSSDCGSTTWQYISAEETTPEVHMVGVVEPGKRDDAVDVYVQRTAAPAILILSAGKATAWQLHLDEGVSLQTVILNGYEAHTVTGAGEALIIDRSGSGREVAGAPTTWPAGAASYQNGLAPSWVYQMEALAGAPLTSFTGCYKAKEFTIR